MGLCAKFDVYNLKWFKMPRMRRPRILPSTFKTKDAKYVYAFGGGQDGIERYDTVVDYH